MIVTKELLKTLDSIDGKAVFEGAGLENWLIEISHQAEQHPYPEPRELCIDD